MTRSFSSRGQHLLTGLLACALFLTVSGYGTGHVFGSTDGGTAWTDLSANLPNIPTSAFVIDPMTAGVAYAGTDIGVFRLGVDGQWTAFNNGIPPLWLSCCTLAPPPKAFVNSRGLHGAPSTASW